MSTKDWIIFKRKLPIKLTEKNEEERLNLFQSMDLNQNGKLSYLEVEYGMLNYLKISEQYNAKKSIKLAFNSTKNTFKPDYDQNIKDIDNHLSKSHNPD